MSTSDLPLTSIKLSDSIVSKLGELAIRTVRQLYARLRREPEELQEYLAISPSAFAELTRQIEAVVRKEYPDDVNPPPHPAVNRSGVAVDRLKDRSRPRYDPGYKK